MKTTRWISVLFLLFFVLPVQSSLTADQSLSIEKSQVTNFGRTIWSAGRKFVIDGKDLIVDGNDPAKSFRLQAPAGALWTTYAQGAAWALTNEQGKGPDGSNAVAMSQYVWQSEDLKTWKVFGILDPLLGPARACVPLDEGVILFVPKSAFLFHEGIWTPLFTTTLNGEGVLKFKAAIPLDLGDPYTLLPGARIPDKPDSTRYQANKKYLIYKNMMFEYPGPLFQTDDGFFIGSMHMGVFWFYDTKGRLKRRYQVFDEMRDGDFSNIWAFERAVLGCQVGPDHHLYLVTRCKEAVFLGQTFYPSTLDQDKSLIDPELAKERAKGSRNSFPDLVWWEIDPTEASPKCISSPPFAPIDVRTIPVGEKVLFSFRPDGVMIFPPSESPKSNSVTLPTGSSKKTTHPSKVNSQSLKATQLEKDTAQPIR